MTKDLGHFRASRVAGRSRLTEAFAAPPLVHRAPRRTGGEAAWLYLGHLGGGLLPGDDVGVQLTVDGEATLVALTQASAKAFRAGLHEGAPRGASLRTKATVAEGGALVLLPDPLVPFADAHVTQETSVALAAGASLFAWDPFTAGREARGERWAFAALTTRTTIAQEGALLHRDALALDRREGPLPRRMGPFAAFGSLVVLGPRFEPLVAPLAARAEALGGAASRFADGRLVIRLGSPEVGGLVPLFAGLIDGLLAPLLGDDPLRGKLS